ncbi:MAG TPA: Sec-independent protein translocase protein TatB [Rhodocyclaceae bacterium]|jgi:sec-independent protein translocase protein TatB|nr:Sec-independent protein translocase protein TatB [Rhodocyclaceae bacterium]
MFDIGFSELIVIALVALIVIGPERLPRVARTAGALLGRFQRYVNDVKSEVRREMELEDLKKFQSELTEQVREVEHSIHKELRSAEEVARGALVEANETIQAPVEEVAGAVKASLEVPAASEPHNPVKPS